MSAHTYTVYVFSDNAHLVQSFTSRKVAEQMFDNCENSDSVVIALVYEDNNILYHYVRKPQTKTVEIDPPTKPVYSDDIPF